EARDANAVDAPGALAGALDLRAQRPHRLAGIDDVLALQKPGDAGFTDRKGAQDQRAMGNRLVAWDPGRALERAGTAGGERLYGLGHGMSLEFAPSPTM